MAFITSHFPGLLVYKSNAVCKLGDWHAARSRGRQHREYIKIERPSDNFDGSGRTERLHFLRFRRPSFVRVRMFSERWREAIDDNEKPSGHCIVEVNLDVS